MDWLNNLIISMWDWVLSFWGDILIKVQEILITAPTDFGGGGIWTIVSNIYGAVAATGYSLIVLFFYIGLIKTTASFAELKRPEVAFGVFIRLILTKAVLDSGLWLLQFFMKLGQGIISSVFQAGGITAQTLALPEEIRTAMQGAVLLEKTLLFWVSFVAVVVIIVMAFTVLLSVYGRFFKIYCCAAIAPLPLSSFAGAPTQNIGIRYLHTFASICLEGAVAAIACVLYSAFITAMPGISVGSDAALIVKLLNYIVTVIFHTLVLSGMIKGADYLLGKFMS